MYESLSHRLDVINAGKKMSQDDFSQILLSLIDYFHNALNESNENYFSIEPAFSSDEKNVFERREVLFQNNKPSLQSHRKGNLFETAKRMPHSKELEKIIDDLNGIRLKLVTYSPFDKELVDAKKDMLLCLQEAASTLRGLSH